MVAGTTPIAAPSGSRAGAAWRVALAAAFALLVAAGLHPLLSAVASFGRYLPAHDLAGDYLAAVVWAVVLGATVLLWPAPFADRLLLLAAWGAKMFIALGFMLYYEWNYPTLDAYGYYAASLSPVLDWEGVGIGHGTENLNAFAWLHARVVPGSYHAMKVSCAMIGLAGVYLFYRAAVAADGRQRRWLLALLLFFPSILFWSTILGKDPLILFGVGVYALGVVQWQRRQRGRYLVLALAGAFVATFIRLWFGPILLGPLFLIALVGLRGAVRRIGFSVVGVGMLWVAVDLFKEQFALASIAELLSAANQWSQGWAEGGSAQLLSGEFTSVSGMIRFLPLGMFTALFRPLPGEVNNMFGLLAGLEDALLLALVGAGLLRTRWRELREPLVLWALSWILIWASLYAFVSFQNLGTAVRFRLPVLPVLLLLCLHLARRRPRLVAGAVGP